MTSKGNKRLLFFRNKTYAWSVGVHAYALMFSLPNQTFFEVKIFWMMGLADKNQQVLVAEYLYGCSESPL